MSNKEEVLSRWKKFLEKHPKLEFNSGVDIEQKAEVCAKYGDVCPCLPKWRKFCPCPEVLNDIDRGVACYCRVFKAKGKAVDLKKHSEMTKKVREKLGILVFFFVLFSPLPHLGPNTFHHLFL